ncbi:TetR/AcrR family transcriptional regulator [Neobacillus cucumis]|uniref:TetR/AcrR family transcriptional regulator n=1 Tax=Neobacillus cucumis TaxID=1740721 RepID=UPI00285307E0|nr:TetR/AcrR family transcriptional regulator [Neobacillus cucumis]MDR4946978.1 TetR/AcrR family transcriptional regulator [Neobacillus cucumis]
MNDRKQHVITKAHQLFIEKGFQATSIIDILEYSGISKGTFYNYFSSKNELLMAIFKSLSQRIDQERNKLLIGQDPADIEIFIQQLELQMDFNRRNKLLTLFEEVFVSNDPALKQYLKGFQLRHLQWIYNRFLDLFKKSQHPYLLDCAIMFLGMLHHNIHYHFMAQEKDSSLKAVIRFTVERVVKMVDEVESSRAQLLNPEILSKWLPDCNKTGLAYEEKLHHIVSALKKHMNEGVDQLEHVELLDFIQEEIIHSKTPRKFLIKSALSTLKEISGDHWQTDIQRLEGFIEEFLLEKSYS